MKLVEIHVRLLNEGTNAIKPVFALKLENNEYLLQQPDDYDPDDEEWEFPPGSIVMCKKKMYGKEAVLLASTIQKTDPSKKSSKEK